MVYTLLKKLDDDFEKARQDNDLPQMRKLAAARAQLSGHLVIWARDNADPNIKKFTYQYMVFDAETKRQAANLEADPAVKTAGLETALKLFQTLQTPEGTAMYRQTLDPAKADLKYPDPAVLLKIALIQFDLERWAAAQEGLGRLLADRKLGTAQIVKPDEETVDNDVYWEAMLKWMISTSKLPDPTAIAEMKTSLKRLYVQWGADTGGKKWRGKFDELRRQVIPDFQLSSETKS